MKRALVAAMLLVTVPARAQPSNNAVAAEALFREGRALLEQHEYREACDKLQKSQQLDPAVGTLLGLGHCYELQARVARGEIIAPAEMADKYFPLTADYEKAAAWVAGSGLQLESSYFTSSL